MRSITCRVARARVRWAATEGDLDRGPLSSHYATCLHCQAEAVRARRTVSQLSQLFDTTEVPPAAVLGAVMAATLETQADDHRVRAASIAAIAVAAGAAVAIRRFQVASR